MGNINMVIGSWGSYNECNERALGSKWLDLSEYSDWDEIVEELKNEGFELDGIDEELFVQDIEGINAFIVVIAQKPSDLIHEGEVLHHCVGRMGYDQKFVREESLIFFVRLKNNPEQPLVTIEYSLSNHKVLQCYGDHDSKPNDEILNFVNKKWLPYANRKLKQIAA